MRNRWFHRPILHTQLDHEKKASWLELFYDLIFVASIIQLGDALSDGVDHKRGLESFLWFAVHFVPLWVCWTGFTFYSNRFDVDDLTHRLLVFLQMAAVGAVAISAPMAMRFENADPRPFEFAYAIAQMVLVIMYARAYKHTPVARDFSRYWGTVFAVGSLLWFAAIFVPSPLNYVLWVFGIGSILLAPLSRASRAISEQYPADQEHLSERYGLLTIIVLGESFVKVLSFLAADDHNIDPEYLAKGAFNLSITCAVWWVYFDDIAGSKIKEGKFTWITWLYGHLPLGMAITAVGVAVKYAVKIDPYAPPSASYRWLLTGTLALTLLSVALIDSVTERRQAELSDGWRVNVRLGSAAAVLLLGAIGSTMSGMAFLGLVAFFCVAQVIFDMMAAPQAALGEHVKHVMTSDLAKVARDNQTQPTGPERRDISEAVRKGTPSELRRDLYYFLMEGSWLQVVAVLAGGFLFANLMFAGLFLLEPGSIIGKDDMGFSDAFAFSVQTMSTIGYGTLSPGTFYGDLLVTVEAAVGLFGVALATGLMFAKVSRPASKVLFADKMVLTTWDGHKKLVFRVGNARGNDVVDATMSVHVLKDEVSAEGHHMRRLYDLELERRRTPIFTLSWTITHIIDDKSPLADVDWDHPEDHLMVITATMVGHDATYAQTTHARHMYYPEDIHLDHRFIDVISQLPDGRLMIDYTAFHNVEPDQN